MQVGELILKLGVVSSGAGALQQFEDNAKKSAIAANDVDKKTHKLDVSTKSLRQNILAGVKAFQAFRVQIVLAAGAMTALTKIASNAAFELVKFTNLTGLSSQQLQAWQQQAAASGVSGDELTQSIMRVQEASNRIQMGEGDAAPWKLLGIDPTQDPFVVLGQLQNQMNSFSNKGMATMFARDLGLSDNVISFIKERDRLPAADKSLLLSENEVKNLKEFNIYFNRVWDNVKRSINKLGVTLAPIATSIMWVFDRMAKALVTISKGFDIAGDKLSKYKGIFIALGIVIAAILFPTLSVILLIAAAIEDVASYVRGDKSLFGDWLANAKAVLAVIEKTIETLKQGVIPQGWKDFADSLNMPAWGGQIVDAITGAANSVLAGGVGPLAPTPSPTVNNYYSNNFTLPPSAANNPKQYSAEAAKAFQQKVSGE
jgi:hypothetical protein